MKAKERRWGGVTNDLAVDSAAILKHGGDLILEDETGRDPVRKPLEGRERIQTLDILSKMIPLVFVVLAVVAAWEGCASLDLWSSVVKGKGREASCELVPELCRSLVSVVPARGHRCVL